MLNEEEAASPGTIFRLETSGDFATLHTFGWEDGSHPTLTQAGDGDFYGTTTEGGTSNLGTVFRLRANGHYEILHNFQGSDGSTPTALMQAADGNFYGSTYGGGAEDIGTIYRLSSLGELTTMHEFRDDDTVHEGARPNALIQSGDNELSGAAMFGGCCVGAGTAGGTLFHINFSGNFQVFGFFDPFTQSYHPNGPLVPGFRGTNRDGGSHEVGGTFQGDQRGHDFDPEVGEGGVPLAPLTDIDGTVLGTTSMGGANGNGTIFEWEGGFDAYTWHDFTADEGSGTEAPLAYINTANFTGIYGSSYSTIYRVDWDHSVHVLHNFTGIGGSAPTAAMVQGEDGNIYGTANGGPFGAGVIFRLTLSQIALNEVSPSSGFGEAGAALTVLGGGFESGTTVTIGGIAANNIIVIDPTFLYLDMPALTPGTYDVKVTAPGGASATLPAAYVVRVPAPTITSFTPSAGPIGTNVTINGTGFTGVSSVKFNGKAASFHMLSATQLTASVSGGTTSGKITVTTAAGTATSATDFLVAVPPTVTGFSPASGVPGTSVVISGTNLDTTSAVAFNGFSASFTINSPAQVTATVPPLATTGKIKVTNAAGGAYSAASFLVSPQITSFTPASGLAGTIVTINGKTFNNASSVQFNGLAAAFTLNSSTKITATVPTSVTTGKIAVTTPGGIATSATSFMVLPKITSFTPAAGPINTKVTVNGTGFTGVSSVKFNGKTASFITVLSPTQLTANVSGGSTSGKVTVTTTAGTATSATNFIVVVPPTVTGFSPAGGVPGTSVVITGTNFDTAAAVAFNGFGATFTINSPTQITATVPSSATTGKIKVTNAAGGASSVASFLVPPQITSFSPDSGHAGTSVTINGKTFNNASTVQFNGIAATFTLNSSTKITATVPPGAATGKIKVTTPGGTATSATNFSVLP
jgi:uncharacterized repeat protein (TIGR03803 family)